MSVNWSLKHLTPEQQLKVLQHMVKKKFITDPLMKTAFTSPWNINIFPKEGILFTILEEYLCHLTKPSTKVCPGQWPEKPSLQKRSSETNENQISFKGARKNITF